MSRLPHAARWQRLTAPSGAGADEQQLRLTVLTFSALLMAGLAVVWVATYAALGPWLSAAIPLAYQLVSFVSIATSAHTRHYARFRTVQLALMLVLPFLLQWTLGGFATSSAVALWALTAPLGALVFAGSRGAAPWFAGFAALVVISGAIDARLPDADVPGWLVTLFFVLNVLAVSATVYAMLRYFIAAREAEQQRSERLLLSILPAPIAARLKREPGPIADACDEVTVLFADIVGFTPLSHDRPPDEVVARSIASSPRSTSSPSATASRGSRRSATPTWLPAACRSPVPIMPGPSPNWRSTCVRPRRWQCASASTAAR